jgi:transketolase
MIKKLINDVLRMSCVSGEGHVPSALSILDILWVLYDKVIGENDKFVLSKGHGALALYAVLKEKGLLEDDLDDIALFDSNLGGHPDTNKIDSVLASTGSLGHGLPMAVGIAKAKKIKGEIGRVFCLVGDGECNEGSIWESLLIASHHNLDNLVCIVDYNRSTDRALKLDGLADKFMSFGWWVNDIDGHDQEMIKKMLSATLDKKPTAVICNTIKGKGIKRMENNPEWHHKSPTLEEYNEMINEL